MCAAETTTTQYAWISNAGQKLDEAAAREAGTVDAGRGLPGLSDLEPPAWINSLVSAASGMIRFQVLDPMQDEMGKIDAAMRTCQDYLKRNASANQRKAAARVPTLVHSPFLYWGIVGILALVEIFFNSAIFQVMGEGMWITYAMAAGLTIVLFAISHLGGHLFRVSLGITALVLVVLDALFALGVLYIVAILRVRFLTETGGASAQDGMLYYGLNLFMFFAAFSLAMLAETQVEKIDRRIAKLEEDRKALWKKAQNKALALWDFVAQLCSNYREANNRERGQSAMWVTPKPVLPPELEAYVPYRDVSRS